MYFRQNGGILLNQYFSGTPVIKTRIFSATELKKATNNYNSKRILGSGGHGTVYKGILKDGTVVAIKKSQEVDQSHVDQFINELLILARVNHKNIVKLLGCCLETQVPLLVYEFIPNGTLHQRLLKCAKDSNFMPWKDRIRVANEIAEALSYLHNHEKMTIVHRDVKSSNILLDDNHTVKLADFGISRLVALDKARVSTAVKGTIGYLDPEYFKTGKLTEKSDVYSYGVVLLELLTSLKPVRHELLQDYSSLVIHFLSYAGESNILGIFEEATLKEIQFEELQAIVEIARSCLTMRGEERPRMKKVAEELASLTGGALSISIPPDKEYLDPRISI